MPFFPFIEAALDMMTILQLYNVGTWAAPNMTTLPATFGIRPASAVLSI
ncbi:MAG: hypothetical protein ABSH56_16855 [Bryobacteraceae bacterium]